MFLFRRSRPAPLTGAPPVRRLKTFQAQSGYVYEYFYEGRREAAGATEFVFSVSADKKTPISVSVVVETLAISRWEQANRPVRDPERYAIAKMALFEAFDARETPAALREPVRVGDAGVASALASLDLD